MHRLEDFDNEYLFVVPRDKIKKWTQLPILSNLYITDLGFYPNADHHYVSRKNGTPEWILIFCTAGAGVAKINNTSYELKEYSLIILPPNISHIYFADNNIPWDIYWCHFQGALADKYPLVKHKQATYIEKIAPSFAKELMDKFNEIIKSYSFDPSDDNQTLYGAQILSSLLASLSVKSLNNKDLKYKNTYVDLTVHYIQKHLSEQIKLSDISTFLKISPGYLCKVFRSNVNLSINQFITKAKMTRASFYLKYTNLTIKEIALRLGYSDSYYFSRVFKKQFSLSPSNYRKQP